MKIDHEGINIHSNRGSDANCLGSMWYATNATASINHAPHVLPRRTRVAKNFRRTITSKNWNWKLLTHDSITQRVRHVAPINQSREQALHPWMAKTDQMGLMSRIKNQNRNNHSNVSTFINRSNIHGEIHCHGETNDHRTAQCLVMPAVPAGRQFGQHGCSKSPTSIYCYFSSLFAELFTKHHTIQQVGVWPIEFRYDLMAAFGFYAQLMKRRWAKMLRRCSMIFSLEARLLGSLCVISSFFWWNPSVFGKKNRLPFHYAVCRQRTKGRLTTSKLIINHHLSVLPRSIPIFFYALVLTISYQLCQLCLHTFHCIDHYYL